MQTQFQRKTDPRLALMKQLLSFLSSLACLPVMRSRVLTRAREREGKIGKGCMREVAIEWEYLSSI